MTPGPKAIYSSKSVEWYTPRWIIDLVLDLFDGKIDLDPCSNAKGDAAKVPALKHYTEEDNGLLQEWSGRVYMNPPYGRGIRPWIEKVRMEYEQARVSEALVLVPGRLDTQWFQIISPKYIRCEITGRVNFEPGPGAKDTGGSGHPSVAFYLGPNIDRFEEVFGPVGVIMVPRSIVRTVALEVPA